MEKRKARHCKAEAAALEGLTCLFGRFLVKYGHGLYYEPSEKGSVHTEALSVKNISFQLLLESLPASALTVNPNGHPSGTSPEMPITITDLLKSAQDTM